MSRQVASARRMSAKAPRWISRPERGEGKLRLAGKSISAAALDDVFTRSRRRGDEPGREGGVTIFGPAAAFGGGRLTAAEAALVVRGAEVGPALTLSDVAVGIETTLTAFELAGAGAARICTLLSVPAGNCGRIAVVLGDQG